MAYDSLSDRRRALTASDSGSRFTLREPPLHVLVNRWLAAGWTVAEEILEEAAQARTAERLSLKEPCSDRELAARIRAMADRSKRSYARWLWKICRQDPPEKLEAHLNSMFMGAHFANLVGHDEVLDALADLVKWRMHYNDMEPDESYPWL